MKNYLLLLSIFLLPITLKAQKTVTLTKDTITYDAKNIERAPSFPGGETKFQEFVAGTLKYPADALQNKIQGDVELSFVVNADGSLSDIKVAKSLAEDLDKEAIRIMKESPKWMPARKAQELVSCSITIPISFKIK